MLGTRDICAASGAKPRRFAPALIVAALAGGLALLGASPGAGQAADGGGWRGIVKSVHHSALSTDIVANIAVLGVREGERFKRGQRLIEFDCRRQRHELAALAAAVREARVQVATNQYLLANGASNRNDVEVAKARHDKADAEHQAMRQRLEGCRIDAPFDGVVVELSVAAHELAPVNRPLMTITSVDLLEIEIIVPSRVLMALRSGAEIDFRIDETGERLRARIVRRAGAIDTVSQTAKVYAQFVAPTPDVLPGMSGQASTADGVGVR